MKTLSMAVPGASSSSVASVSSVAEIYFLPQRSQRDAKKIHRHTLTDSRKAIMSVSLISPRRVFNLSKIMFLSFSSSTVIPRLLPSVSKKFKLRHLPGAKGGEKRIPESSLMGFCLTRIGFKCTSLTDLFIKSVRICNIEPGIVRTNVSHSVRGSTQLIRVAAPCKKRFKAMLKTT